MDAHGSRRSEGASEATPDDPVWPPLFSRDAARKAGNTDRQVTARLRSGLWVAVRRGILHPSQAGDDDEVRALPADVVAALLAQHSRDVVASHRSAARMHELPRPRTGWGPPTLTAPCGPTRRRNGVHVLVAPLAGTDVVHLAGCPVTSLARTVADNLRTLPPHDALAVADAATRRGLRPADLARVLDGQRGWPGIVQARALAAMADGSRETPLESWSAWTLHRWAVPSPQWQVDVRDAEHRWLARVDCWWAVGVAGEADGRAKYALAAAERGGATATAVFDVLQAERQREQRLRATGVDVVRWGAPDVLRDRLAGELARRITIALARARGAGRV